MPRLQPEPIKGTIISAVIGGIGSVLGGGKFANGAITGAFAYLAARIAEPLSDKRYLSAGDRVSTGAYSYGALNGTNGNGTVTVLIYRLTPYGLDIMLRYDGSVTDPEWIQSIWTTEPLNGGPPQYNDPYPPDDGLPFYWTASDYANLGSAIRGLGYSVFSDTPSRIFSVSAQWYAELTLVGRDASGAYQPLATFTYGLTIAVPPVEAAGYGSVILYCTRCSKCLVQTRFSKD